MLPIMQPDLSQTALYMEPHHPITPQPWRTCTSLAVFPMIRTIPARQAAMSQCMNQILLSVRQQVIVLQGIIINAPL